MRYVAVLWFVLALITLASIVRDDTHPVFVALAAWTGGLVTMHMYRAVRGAE